MTNIQQTVLRYEKARQEINRLKSECRELYYKCTGIKEEDLKPQLGDNCVQTAYKFLYDDDNMVSPCLYGRQPASSYDEILSNFGCYYCNKAREIKKGSLAIEINNMRSAKISLSAIGKKLIKQSQENNNE